MSMTSPATVVPLHRTSLNIKYQADSDPANQAAIWCFGRVIDIFLKNLSSVTETLGGLSSNDFQCDIERTENDVKWPYIAAGLSGTLCLVMGEEKYPVMNVTVIGKSYNRTRLDDVSLRLKMIFSDDMPQQVVNKATGEKGAKGEYAVDLGNKPDLGFTSITISERLSVGERKKAVSPQKLLGEYSLSIANYIKNNTVLVFEKTHLTIGDVLSAITAAPEGTDEMTLNKFPLPVRPADDAEAFSRNTIKGPTLGCR